MLLLWALVPAFGLAVIGLIGWLTVWGYRRIKAQPGQAVPVGAITVLAGCLALPFVLVCGLLFGAPFLTSLRPASADFEEGFGMEAGSEITNLQGLTRAGVDARSIYLAFDNTAQARAAVAARLTGAASVPQTDRLDSDIFAGNAPAWFEGAGRRCTRRELLEYHNALGWDALIVVACSSDRRIYVMFSNID